jgi:uncharacterized protein involved in type VI secretion and phage assembly
MTQELDLLGLLQGRVSTLENELEESQQRVYGVTLGEVTSLDDPKFLGRVQVRLPWLTERSDSAWARIASGWAGGSRGAHFLPEVGDEVVVAFRHGLLHHPYILGFLWSDTERPPVPSPWLKRSELRSKSGHKIVFDDLVVNESLTLESQGGHTIVLDDSAVSTEISISDSTHNLKIVLDSESGKITISSTVGQIAVSAPAGKISLDAAAVDVHATGTLTLKGDTAVVVRGTAVRIN